jgi:translation initiation factor 2 alpha subunit (eIF-2alpha)
MGETKRVSVSLEDIRDHERYHVGAEFKMEGRRYRIAEMVVGKRSCEITYEDCGPVLDAP